jgi:hypothetical protein
MTARLAGSGVRPKPPGPEDRAVARLLVLRAEQVASSGVSAAIPPCRDQVRNGPLEIMAIPAWLRIAQPVDPWGVAISRGSLVTVVGHATSAVTRPGYA